MKFDNLKPCTNYEILFEHGYLNHETEEDDQVETDEFYIDEKFETSWGAIWYSVTTKGTIHK